MGDTTARHASIMQLHHRPRDVHMSNETYKSGVYEAWVGEIFGESFFAELAGRCPGSPLEAKWTLLAELERVTGQQLEPLVRRHGYDLDPPDDAKQRGVTNAEEFCKIPHLEFMAQIEPYLEDVVAKYQVLRDTAPPEDAVAMQFLVDHEAALLRFVQLEQSESAQDSTQAVKSLIEKAR